MARTRAKAKPTWIDVKERLSEFSRPELVNLIHDLYAANEDNRLFLHTRFALHKEPLKPYLKALDRWLWPDVLRNQDASAAKAKEVIAKYRKSGGEPAGLAELKTYYCEQAMGFVLDVGYDDRSFLDALLNMFADAVAAANELPSDDGENLLTRLDHVSTRAQDIGYGVGDTMDYLMSALAPGRDWPQELS